MSEGRLWGPLPPQAVHLCIDMQNLFAVGSPWETPWMDRVLPCIEELVGSRPQQTIFTRFLPPRRLEDCPGTWQRLYRRWPQITREQADPRLFELVPALAKFAPPAQVLDKGFYSPFFRSPLREVLAARHTDTLIISGAETDICVMAAVIDAIDYGFRTVIVEDAICSSSDGTHDALLKLYRERFSNQIELAGTRSILEHWIH
jgi:nicotinamidase-related amidase